MKLLKINFLFLCTLICTAGQCWSLTIRDEPVGHKVAHLRKQLDCIGKKLHHLKAEGAQLEAPSEEQTISKEEELKEKELHNQEEKLRSAEEAEEKADTELENERNAELQDATTEGSTTAVENKPNDKSEGKSGNTTAVENKLNDKIEDKPVAQTVSDEDEKERHEKAMEDIEKKANEDIEKKANETVAKDTAKCEKEKSIGNSAQVPDSSKTKPHPCATHGGSIKEASEAEAKELAGEEANLEPPSEEERLQHTIERVSPVKHHKTNPEENIQEMKKQTEEEAAEAKNVAEEAETEMKKGEKSNPLEEKAVKEAKVKATEALHKVEEAKHDVAEAEKVTEAEKASETQSEKKGKAGDETQTEKEDEELEEMNEL